MSRVVKMISASTFFFIVFPLFSVQARSLKKISFFFNISHITAKHLVFLCPFTRTTILERFIFCYWHNNKILRFKDCGCYMLRRFCNEFEKKKDFKFRIEIKISRVKFQPSHRWF